MRQTLLIVAVILAGAAPSFADISEGEALCRAGTIEAHFISGTDEYCSHIESPAQGYCMKTAAENHYFLESARRECRVNVPMAVTRAERNEPKTKLGKLLSFGFPDFAALYDGDRKVGELKSVDTKASQCELRRGDEFYNNPASCQSIFSELVAKVSSSVELHYGDHSFELEATPSAR